MNEPTIYILTHYDVQVQSKPAHKRAMMKTCNIKPIDDGTV